jgi:hypothetical protein
LEAQAAGALPAARQGRAAASLLRTAKLPAEDSGLAPRTGAAEAGGWHTCEYGDGPCFRKTQAACRRQPGLGWHDREPSPLLKALAAGGQPGGPPEAGGWLHLQVCPTCELEGAAGDLLGLA